MKIRIAFLLLVSVVTLRADQAIGDAQQVLKDQGFYYGQVTGEKNADTSAAIRRFQIRNGLQVTGELNDETVQSLHKAPAATPAPAATVLPAPPVRSITPAPNEDTSDLRDDNGSGKAAPNAGSGQQFAPPPAVPQVPQIYPGRPVPPGGRLLPGTPYENAPLEVQQKVVADAQTILARRGLFKHEIDGVFSPDLEFSLRAYQSRVGLQTTGRLDLETLAALELLPGSHERVYTPRRGLPPGAQLPPVRGEWVRP
jgi:peptidoglycan hydrolase-like protein with peptidoglycan-binding domain